MPIAKSITQQEYEYFYPSLNYFLSRIRTFKIREPRFISLSLIMLILRFRFQ